MFASRATVHRCCIDTSSNSCFTKIAFWRKWAQNCVIMAKSHLSSWRSLPDLQVVGRAGHCPPPPPRQYKLYQLVTKPSLANGPFNKSGFPGGWARAKSISDLDMAMRMAEAGEDNWWMRPQSYTSLHHQYFGEPGRPEQRQGRYRKQQSKKSTQRFGIRKSSHQPQLFGSGSNLLSLNRLSRSETNLKQCDQLLGDCIRYGERFLCLMNVSIKFSVADQ